ncbi:MAG TPA: type II secretion system protein [Verrucomicrobiales bacterium]|nr:type II secretion system protein [Verrucomicrobiales bacterium]
MKTCCPRPARARSAFTLIELLVVITIIAILAAVSVPVGTKVINGARKAAAKSDCLNLVNAIRMYYTEYNRYPVAGGGAGEGPFETTRQLMDVLMNNRNSPEVAELNPRGIAFFEPSKIAKEPRAHGFVDGTRDFNDPWGTPYQVYIDVDYDEHVEVPRMYSQQSANSTLPKGTIAHSAGPDRDFNKIRDNVTSWQ